MDIGKENKMGWNPNCKVVCGFRLDVQEAYKNITKYNEDTGQPFTKKVFSHYTVMVEDKELCNRSLDAERLCNGEELDNLEVFEAGYEEGEKVLGLSLGRRWGDDNTVLELKLTIPEEVSNFAKEHGLTPKFFLIMS